MGQVVFYEGNGGSQDIVHSTDDRPGQNFRPNKNDEARSVVLTNVRVGARIEVYDSPDASKSDDYTYITSLKEHPSGYIVGSFERSYTDDYVRVEYTRKNGLDGKVSRIIIN